MTTAGSAAVRILGAHDRRTAYSVVNAQLRRRLGEAGVTLVEDDSADLLIHHDYSVRFGDATVPPARRRVAFRPWDFGPYPPRWVRVVEDQYDELWVFTQWSKECAIRGGLDPARVRVVPLGVDPSAFAPDGAAHPLTTSTRSTILFAGAAIERKGVDIALRAFLEAFDGDDPIQLVVKDHTGDVFYDGLSKRDELLAASTSPGSPPIHYVDAYLPQPELAALYRGATALVHPARAEGWAMPVLESLACGTPVIVPDFGPFRDYCRPPAAELVDVRRIRAPVDRDFTINTLGFRERVTGIDFCEPVVGSVVAALRRAMSWSPDDLAARRRAARALGRRWSWTRTTATILDALHEITPSAGLGR